MNMNPTFLLIAVAGFPVVGAVLVLVCMLMGRRRIGLALTRLSFLGGSVCGIMLSALLLQKSDPSTPLYLRLCNWFAFSLPQSPSITFGLEATWIKAGLIGLTGALGLIALWNADSNRPKPRSDDTILSSSLLYATGIVFVFAPNMAQSLMGWGAVSILAGILIRLSRLGSEINRNQFDVGSIQTSSQSQGNLGHKNTHRGLSVLNIVIAFLERAFDRAWHSTTEQFPSWLGEQVEVLERSAISHQLLATLLGASAILLTWML